MAFELPKLNYAYDALEPHIDARTMEIHHSKHHNGYTTKLNAAIEGTALENESIESILGNLDMSNGAVRNNGGGFYSRELYIHEARMHGADIQLPCINTSENETIIRGKTIYLGLNFIKELEYHTVHEVLMDRQKKGAFLSVDDFVKRVSISLDQLSLLIRIGAFRFTGKDKKALLWHAYFLLGNTGKSQNKPSLFDPPVKKYKLPEIEHEAIEDVYDEVELLGFPLESPFNLLSEKRNDCVPASKLPLHINKVVLVMGYLVATKHTSTSKGDRMYFGTFLDEDGSLLIQCIFRLWLKSFPLRAKASTSCGER